MVAKKTEKMLSRVALILTAILLFVAVNGIVLVQMENLPPTFQTSAEVDALFDTRIKEVNQILVEYGLTAVPQYTGEEKWRIYDVQLNDGEVLQISLSNYFPSQSYFGISLFSSVKNTPQECVPDFEKYPFYFEVAQALSNNHFHADRYRHLCEKVKKEGNKLLTKGHSDGLMGDTHLRTLLLLIGSVEYFIMAEDDGFESEISIFSRVY